MNIRLIIAFKKFQQIALHLKIHSISFKVPLSGMKDEQKGIRMTH